MPRTARLQWAGGVSAAAASLLIPAAAWAQEAVPAAMETSTKPDTGDTAWMLISAALVLLMTPGLALFYGGMVRSKNILNILMQSFVAMAVVTLIWVIAGYSIAFAPGNPFFGNASYMGLGNVGQNVFTLNGVATTIPHQVFMVYQMMFAIITPALISGAIAERMKFGAYVIFIAVWSLVIYAPLAHMVWGEGGFLLKLGALDFAGGTVVHISSGISALVLAIMLGKRRLAPSEDVRPHNLPMTLIGTGLLWFGWFGFNAGSAGASGGLAGSAFVVTQIAAATAALVWILIEWVTIKKPTALGFATGGVAGLVAITPASGYVSPLSAIAIGFGVSCVSYMAIKMKSRFGYDDTLDVFGVHCVGGIWGALATGLFADKLVNSAVTDNGLLMGGGATLLGKQFIGVLVALAMGAIGTLVIAGIIKAVSGIRASAEDEEVGLDVSQHGEEGYHGGTSDAATHTGFAMAGNGGIPVATAASKSAPYTT